MKRKYNTLTAGQVYNLFDWLKTNYGEAGKLPAAQADVAEKATKALGFAVTAARVGSACRSLGIKAQQARQSSIFHDSIRRIDAAMAELTEAFKELDTRVKHLEEFCTMEEEKPDLYDLEV